MDVSRTIEVPAAVAWEVLTDTHVWSTWGPSVAGVDHDGRYLHAGSRGRVRTAVGPTIPFEVSDFEPGRRWAWRVAGVPATGHRVDPLGDTRCRVVFEIPAVAAAYAAVCWVALRRIEILAEQRNASS